MYDISGFGFVLTIVGSVTFPSGFTVSEFADDADPFDTPAVTIGNTAMGSNGDLVGWSSAAPAVVNLNVIPGSDDDANLEILFEANRVASGKTSAKDEITITAAYSDGRVVTYSGGKCTSYVPDPGLANSGRLKTRPYSFAFENRDRS